MHTIYLAVVCTLLFISGASITLTAPAGTSSKLPFLAHAAVVPVLFYSDLPGGMCTGGPNNKGHIVTIRGKDFGQIQDGEHYVTIAEKRAAAYLLWQDDKIAFQPGCAVPAGDYTITVTTPAGISNKLPFHIYSGSTIYFADQGQVTGIVGRDSNNGKSPATPFLTLTKCRTMANAPGNSCYLMPGFKQTVLDNSAYLFIADMAGAPDKYIGIIGYPTNDSSQVPQISYRGAGPPNSIDIRRSKYIVIAEMKTVGNAGYSAVSIGQQPYTAHHIRVIDIDQTEETHAAVTALQTVYSSHIQIYGLLSHDMNNSVTGKRVGHVYIGDSSHDVDVGWSKFDGSCSYNYPNPCHDGKQLEIHNTPIVDAVPAPATPTLTRTSGGTLTAGIYDVVVNYRSKRWFYNNFGFVDTFTTPSTAQTIVLDGSASQDAIKVTHPPGYNRIPTLDDGDSVLCNPSLAYQVFACKRSSASTACVPADFQYQGESLYTNTKVYNGISGTDFTINSLASGTGLPRIVQGYDGNVANYSGCNIYNVVVHDSMFIDPPDYAWALAANWDANPPHYIRFFNNVVMNAANYANAPNISDFASVCFTVGSDYTWDKPSGGTLEILNNTFYNCGSLTSYWTDRSVFDYGAGWDTRYPRLTLNFQNNIAYQPQAGQTFQGSGNYANFTVTGSNNLCYGPANAPGVNRTSCPAAWGPGSVNRLDPLFTSNGKLTADPAVHAKGGPIYVDPDVALRVGSPAIDAGYDVTTIADHDIRGLKRPQGSAVDIGAYEYAAERRTESSGGNLRPGTSTTLRQNGNSKDNSLKQQHANVGKKVLAGPLE